MREEVPNIEEGGADLLAHLVIYTAERRVNVNRFRSAQPTAAPARTTTFVCVTPPSPLARHQARDALQHPYFDEVRSHRHRALASSLLRAPIRAASDRRYVRSPTPRCLGSRTFSVRRITCRRRRSPPRRSPLRTLQAMPQRRPRPSTRRPRPSR